MKINFAENLKCERERQNLSIPVLAKKSGLAVTSIYRMESGRVKPSTKTIERLATALKISVPELISGRPDPAEEARRIAEKIKSHRKKTGISRDDLAAKSRLPEAVIRNIEAGRPPMPIGNLRTIAAALNIPPAEIIPTIVRREDILDLVAANQDRDDNQLALMQIDEIRKQLSQLPKINEIKDFLSDIRQSVDGLNKPQAVEGVKEKNADFVKKEQHKIEISEISTDFFSARLKSERLRRGWSLSELARQSGVTHGALSRIEKTGKVAARTISRIAAAFDMDIPELLGVDTEPRAASEADPEKIQLREENARLRSQVDDISAGRLVFEKKLAEEIKRAISPDPTTTAAIRERWLRAIDLFCGRKPPDQRETIIRSLGVDYADVWPQIRAGKIPVPHQALSRAGSILNISLEWLLRGDGEIIERPVGDVPDDDPAISEPVDLMETKYRVLLTEDRLDPDIRDHQLFLQRVLQKILNQGDAAEVRAVAAALRRIYYDGMMARRAREVEARREKAPSHPPKKETPPESPRPPAAEPGVWTPSRTDGPPD